MTRAVLWDLDGTLVDSADYHYRAWCETLAAEGASMTHEFFLSTFGQRNDVILPRLFDGPVDPARLARIGIEKEACFRRLIRREGLLALPGAAEWVARLKQDGWLQAIASSAPRLNVEAMLDALGLSRMFQAVAASEDVRCGKPDPEVFLTAAQKLGVPPARSIVVEDAPAGVEAARRAGMRSIGVRANGPPLAADVVVRSLAALSPAAFEQLLAQ